MLSLYGVMLDVVPWLVLIHRVGDMQTVWNTTPSTRFFEKYKLVSELYLVQIIWTDVDYLSYW